MKASEFEAKFETGEDITEDLDLDRARRVNHAKKAENARLRSRRASGEIRDAVRRAAIEHFFAPARQREESEVTITARDVGCLIDIRDRYPAICNALRDKKGELQSEAKVDLVDAPKKDSTDATFTYRLRRK